MFKMHYINCLIILLLPEDIKGNRKGHNVEVRCKFDTSEDANIKSISVFRKLCLAMFASTEKALETFDSNWTTLTTNEYATIKQLR